MNFLTLSPRHCAVLVVYFVLFSTAQSQDKAKPTAVDRRADLRTNQTLPARPGTPPSFDVRIVPANTTPTILSLTRSTATKDSSQEADSGHLHAPDSATKETAPPAKPVAIEEVLGGLDNEPAFEAPTVILFLSGFHLDIIPNPSTTALDVKGDANSTASKDTPAKSAGEDKGTVATITDSLVRGRVQIALAPPPMEDDIDAAIPDPKILIFDRNGKENDFNGRLNTAVEGRILRDILATWPFPLTSGAVRDVLDLVEHVTSYSLIDRHAGHLARALDLAALVKAADGARGAIVYIHGETNQTFFDDLNVSSLNLPITTYVGRDGFADYPEGFGDLSHYPATVVMWKNRRIVEVYRLSQQDLGNLETSGKAKEILVRYLELFEK